MIQPEVAFTSMLQTSKKDAFTGQSKKGFFINSMFLIVMLFTVKFSFEEFIPNSFQIIGILFSGIIIISFLFYLVNLFNNKIVRNKFQGLLSSMCIMTFLIFVLGMIL